MSTNDTLLDQCRREVPYNVQPHPNGYVDFWTVTGPTVSGHVLYSEWDEAKYDANELNEAYALALFHERSKSRTSLSVEDIEACMDEIGDPPDNPDHFWLWREKVSARLTAKLNELNTPTNG